MAQTPASPRGCAPSFRSAAELWHGASKSRSETQVSRYWQISLTQKMPFIGIASGVLDASENPTLVAISSAFVGISASVPQGRRLFLADHKRGYRGLTGAADQG